MVVDICTLRKWRRQEEGSIRGERERKNDNSACCIIKTCCLLYDQRETLTNPACKPLFLFQVRVEVIVPRHALCSLPLHRPQKRKKEPPKKLLHVKSRVFFSSLGGGGGTAKVTYRVPAFDQLNFEELRSTISDRRCHTQCVDGNVQASTAINFALSHCFTQRPATSL